MHPRMAMLVRRYRQHVGSAIVVGCLVYIVVSLMWLPLPAGVWDYDAVDPDIVSATIAFDAARFKAYHDGRAKPRSTAPLPVDYTAGGNPNRPYKAGGPQTVRDVEPKKANGDEEEDVIRNPYYERVGLSKESIRKLVEQDRDHGHGPNGYTGPVDPIHIIPVIRDDDAIDLYPREPGNILDHFVHFEKCNISSENIVGRSQTLKCSEPDRLLRSMSYGGRIGVDAGYHARGCAMRFLATENICRVVSRFSKIIFVGDDLLEAVFSSLFVLLREDMHGAVRHWNLETYDEFQCGTDCAAPFDGWPGCDAVRIRDAEDVRMYNPQLLKCPRMGGVEIKFIRLEDFPVTDLANLEKLATEVKANPKQDTRAIAIVYGQGYKTQFDAEVTRDWIVALRATVAAARDVPAQISPLHELFVTSGATGPLIASENAFDFGLKATHVFERRLMDIAADMNLPMLGTWNATVQTKFASDGLHSSLSTNLLKIMMILNYFDLINPHSPPW